ncbi:MAG: transglycosylase domain-containing protein [Bryobacteraceae bacterium]
MLFEPEDGVTEGAPVRRKFKFGLPRLGSKRVVLGCLASAAIAVLAVAEARSSYLQSRLFAAMARRMTYRVEPGPASLPLAGDGPYDTRMGYARIDGWIRRLEERGFEVESQARSSDWLRRMTWFGLFPTYREKSQAGLEILDTLGRPLFAAQYPQRAYPEFDWIPPLVVNSLLFVENRDMLDTSAPYRNPAVEWDRLARAVFDQSRKQLVGGTGAGGGSTLATQIEKLRHSPEGRTQGAGDKFRQMLSASMRAYQLGEATYESRKQITSDYINSLPLASLPGYGEVSGLGDGLWAWFGADFAQTNRLLAAEEGSLDPPGRATRARAYRRTLSLLLAANRPSHYLQRNRKALEHRVDSYLRMLGEAGVISPGLRDSALAVQLDFRAQAPDRPQVPFYERKAMDAVRASLLGWLNIGSVYDLDRLDLTVHTSLDRVAVEGATKVLQRLKDRSYAAKAGLIGHQMLPEGAIDSVIYSFNLYEAGEGMNFLRVQADNYDQPLNFNEGTRIELGSTAKLRTLVTYLELIADLHKHYARKRTVHAAAEPADTLTQWVIAYLASSPDRTLAGILEAAVTREYSGSPAEGFFTGGGLHYFSNFNGGDNGRRLTVRDALRNSTNLVFIRMMRDIETYFQYRLPGVTPALLDDVRHPGRKTYLSRFADREGREFLLRFYRRYKDKPVEEALAILSRKMRPTPYRLAVAYRTVLPEGDLDGMLDFLESKLPDEALARVDIERLYNQYAPGKFDLGDRGYLARVHPLELWLLRYLMEHRQADFEEVTRASVTERQEVYKWLFRPKHKHAQDLRIRILLEVDAFLGIQKKWANHGYPFPSLTPSLATAIGSSGDNPAALAELAGIIQNGGVRYPSMRLERLHFARATPLETVMRHRSALPVRVLPAAVAAVVRQEMFGVVEQGTARRAFQSVKLSDGSILPLGGKTGTGDNRLESYASNGALLQSKAMSRTAAFVFVIGDRFYGTVTAYVPGEQAEAFSFTSALAVQIFRQLVPTIRPVLERAKPVSMTPEPERPDISESEMDEMPVKRPIKRVVEVAAKPAPEDKTAPVARD